MPSLTLLRTFTTLEQVTAWAFALPDPPSLDVVAQDEFTLDVVLGLGDGLWVVFDTT